LTACKIPIDTHVKPLILRLVDGLLPVASGFSGA
jgi:hypothetical protein